MIGSASNPYRVLGVSRWGSKDEIKSAYREMVKRFHPDQGDDGTDIVLINQAYEVLRKKRGF